MQFSFAQQADIALIATLSSLLHFQVSLLLKKWPAKILPPALTTTGSV
jgi:hypothetical protein